MLLSIKFENEVSSDLKVFVRYGVLYLNGRIAPVQFLFKGEVTGVDVEEFCASDDALDCDFLFTEFSDSTDGLSGCTESFVLESLSLGLALPGSSPWQPD